MGGEGELHVIDLDQAQDAVKGRSSDDVICVTTRWVRAVIAEIECRRKPGSYSEALDLSGTPPMPPVAR